MKMRIGWLLQQHYLDTEDHGDALVSVIKAQGFTVQIVDWAPGNRTQYAWQGEAVDIIGVIGTIGFVRRFHEDFEGPPLYPFFSEEVHRYSHYQHKIPREHLLNSRGCLLPFAEVARRPVEEMLSLFGGERIFMRPDQALKVCEAQCLDASNFSQWLHDSARYTGLSPVSLLWFFPAQSVGNEYRFVVADKKIVTGSQYLDGDDKLAIKKDVPRAAKIYAEHVAPMISLDERVYILDVAEVAGGYKIIELNAFSTSGMYAGDKAALIHAASLQLSLIAHEWYD